MKILKFIDHWVGSPICVVLSLIERLTHPHLSSIARINLKHSPQSILVIKVFGLGSILLTSNLLRGLKEKYPSAKIIFLTNTENKEFLNLIHLADEVRTVSFEGPITTIWVALSQLFYFSFHKPEIAIDLEYFSKFGTIMAYLSGAKWRVGFYLNQFWRGSLINVPVYFNYERHILETYRLFGQTMGITVAEGMPEPIPVREETKRSLEQLFSDNGIKANDLLLAVNVNASGLAYCRRWPLEKFASVIQLLLTRNKNLKIILTGNKIERAYTSCLVARLAPEIRDKVFDFSGLLNIEKFIALIERVDLLLTNDSGPFHLAQVQNTPTLSLWGAGSPTLYGPYDKSSERHRIIYKRWPCSPCLYIYRTDAGFLCKGRAPCLRDISESEVVQAAQDVLGHLIKGRGKEGRVFTL